MSVLDNVMIGAFLRYPGAAAARDKARQVIGDVGLGPLADAPAKSLGTPGRKRLEIARALASEPKVLLLDEAMAGLTPTEIRTAIDLVRQIHGTGITLVIVEHIMEVIVSLASRVVVFHQGTRDRARHAAGGDPQRARHRGLSGQAPRGQAERGRRMTAPLLEVRNLEVRYGDLIGVADVSLEVPQGSIVALLGSNGAGKTTTLNAIAGVVPASGGQIEFQGRDITGAARLRHRAQGAGAVARGLAAVRAAERGEEPAARRHAARRQVAHRAHAGARLRAVPEAGRAAGSSRPAPCRAASARCWPSAAR